MVHHLSRRGGFDGGMQLSGLQYAHLAIIIKRPFYILRGTEMFFNAPCPMGKQMCLLNGEQGIVFSRLVTIQLILWIEQVMLRNRGTADQRFAYTCNGINM